MSARDVIRLVLFFVGFPLVWPAFRVRDRMRLRAFHHARGRLGRETVEGIVARVADGEARAASLHRRVFYSMASGPDDDAVLVVAWEDGGASASAEVMRVLASLEARGVEVRRSEAVVSGIGLSFGWMVWGIVVMAALASVALLGW